MARMANGRVSPVSVSPSSMFYPPHKLNIQHLTANPEWATTILITKITAPYDISAISLYHFIRIKEKELNIVDKSIFLLCCNMFTQCDGSKNFGATLFAMPLQCGVTRYQFCNFVEFIAKLKFFLL